VSRRIRKHANPFTVTAHLGALDRPALFGREAPLEVDVGCGGARFLFDRARNHPERDFVGLEVRKPLVEAAARRREVEGPTNVRVFHAAAAGNLCLGPPGAVAMFHVQFPDPCFKKRHWKRRILQPRVVREMAEALAVGGRIYAQSDVKPLAEEMFDFLSAEAALRSLLDPSLLAPSPLDERTEWERHHEALGEPIYRMLFEKVAEPSGPVPSPEFRDTNPRRLAASGVEDGDAG
jgi:tRNA (guanine-N7-)-methyltransferase